MEPYGLRFRQRIMALYEQDQSTKQIAATLGTSESGTRQVEAVGCRVLYLPPYSPDLNPIENAISKIKAALKHLAARTVQILGEAIRRAVQSITAADAQGFFRHCGYFAREM